MELKLIADVAIVGKPNAGKSTLLSRVSAARPKVAAYPFTTVEPVLGVVEMATHTMVLVEIPGLLEGAHAGVGLGDEFLRHMERTRVLVHLVDGMEEDPRASLGQTREEMRLYRPSLLEKPYVVAVNKLDVTEVRQRRDEIQRNLAPMGMPVMFISAVTGEGVEPLLYSVHDMLQSLPGTPLPAREARAPEPYRRSPHVRVHKDDDEGLFRVEAPQAERLVGLADLKDWRVRLQLHQELTRLGVTRALRKAGVRPGDTVVLGGQEFEWE